MSLEPQVMNAMKVAMRAKDTVTLEALRAIKSSILLAKTSGIGGELSSADEMALLQKLVKQRKDSAAIYQQQNRVDLADPELAQAAVIEQFLPKQLSEDEVEAAIKPIVERLGATGIKDMGKVMGEASKELAGKTNGKTISLIVRKLLS